MCTCWNRSYKETSTNSLLYSSNLNLGDNSTKSLNHEEITRWQEYNYTLESISTHWRKETTVKLLHLSKEIHFQSAIYTLTHLQDEEGADNINHLGYHRLEKALEKESPLFFSLPFTPQAPHYQWRRSWSLLRRSYGCQV